MQDNSSGTEALPGREGPSSVFSPLSSVASPSAFRQRGLDSREVSPSSYSDSLHTKEHQLYRRLDEGIAATIVHSRRSDMLDGRSTAKEDKIHSSSIFEKYRDNLAGSGIHCMERGNERPQSSGIQDRGREKELKYLNIRSTVAKGGPGDPSPSSAKTEISRLLSSDAERFMDFTMSSPPQQQLVQLRVLELFQIWISSGGVREEIKSVLEDACKGAGVGPVVRPGWSENHNAGDTNGKNEGTLKGEDVEQDRSVRTSAKPSSSQENGKPKENHSNNSQGSGELEGETDKAVVGALTVESLIKHQGQEEPPVAPVKTPPPARLAEGGASYEDIPRFYFPLGKPTTREKVISAPLYKFHENPHLRLPQDGPTMADSRSSSKLSNSSLQSSVGSSSSARANGKPGESRLPPMSSLRFADDRHVGTYIKKEFARLNAPSRHQKGRLGSSSRRSNSSSKETQLRHHFHQCIQRICSQCFGVPRYFAFIIIGLIQAELSNTEEYTNLTGSVKGGLPFISPQSYAVINADHVQEFYEKYLKNKDTLRRTFDLLILSSRLTNPEESTKEPTDLSSLRAHLIGGDFKAYILTLLSHHPGLGFLRQTPDFQFKYLDTVIYRIFYVIDRFDRGGINFPEFITSPLMDAFRQVDAAEDINSVLLFFSYEHFYVLYCRFWELDDDRDMLLSQQDLMRYAPDDAMNSLVVQRVFAGAGRRNRCPVKNRIGYEDFVWFCLSEEDKSTPTAIRYWFKVLDLDEDGVLSAFEIRAFYEATTTKASQYLQDNAVTFENAICQIFDMLRCQEYRWLKLSDLLSEPVASYVALNMITSIIKFLQFEYKDPFVLQGDRMTMSVEQSPWDKFARTEYDRMSKEGDD